MQSKSLTEPVFRFMRHEHMCLLKDPSETLLYAFSFIIYNKYHINLTMEAFKAAVFLRFSQLRYLRIRKNLCVAHIFALW